MATHSSVLAWRIPGMMEPGGLPSLGSQSQTRPKRLSSSSSSRACQWQLFDHSSSFFITCLVLPHLLPLLLPPWSEPLPSLVFIHLLIILGCAGSSLREGCLAVEPGDYSLVVVHGLLNQWLLLWAQALGCTGFYSCLTRAQEWRLPGARAQAR